MNKILKILIISLLILSSIPLSPLHVTKATNNENTKLKILQLIDSSSVISSNLLSNNDGNFDVTTMDMKSFVAERKDLDGLYDAIYIAEGEYSSELPDVMWSNYGNASKVNNTEARMNDITELKANEIISYYVRKGLPVLLNSSNFSNDQSSKKSILRDHLYSLLDGKYKNVISIKKISDVIDFFKNYINNRPRISILNYNSDQRLAKGDYLSITFNVQYTGEISKLLANLSFDSNFDNQYEVKDIVVSTSISELLNNNGQYTITYRLPESYSGMRSWKLEIIDEETDFKDYAVGDFLFSGTKMTINVLQVVNKINTGNIVSILKDKLTDLDSDEKEMGISGKYEHEDFTINIYDVTYDKFNSETDSGITNYKNLNNGTFNMLIFGFANDYGSLTKIFEDTNALQVKDEVEKFYLENKKSLFLTHDTLFRDLEEPNNWVDIFLEHSGQTYKVGDNSYLETNMGIRGRVTAFYSKLVNDGLMTMYPYELTKSTDERNIIKINKTHAQYFALNLEDKDVIPWFNLYNGLDEFGNDVNDYILKGNDAWNHYYTYSYRNITYSGAGHAPSGFDLQEKELFINTMYRAFLSANAEPTIEVVKPTDKDKVYSYQKEVPIHFFIKDLDPYDLYLDTYLKVNDDIIMDHEKRSNGDEILKYYELKDTDKKLDILIEVKDPKGSTVKKKWTVDVIDLEGEFIATKEFSRNLEPMERNEALGKGYAQKGTSIQLTYTLIAPEEIEPLAGNEFTQDTTFKFNLSDEIPEGIKIGCIFISKCNKDEQLDNTISQKIERVLPEIEYYVSEGKLKIKNTEMKEIKVTANLLLEEIGEYTFNKTLLTRDNEEPLQYNDLTLKVIDGLQSILIQDEVHLKINGEKNIKIEYKPSSIEENKKELITDISWKVQEKNNKEIVKITESNKERVVLTGNEKGKGDLVVIAKDIFGNCEEGNMKVYVNTLSIEVSENPIYIRENEIKKLDILVNPIDTKNKNFRVEMDDMDIATFDQSKMEIKGIKEGSTFLTVTSELDDSVNIVVPVYVGKIGITTKYNPIIVGIEGEDKTIDLDIKMTPEKFPNNDYKVEIEKVNGEIIAEYDKKTKKLTGFKTGETTLTIISTLDENVRLVVPLYVYKITVLPNPIEVNIGEFIEVSIEIQPKLLNDKIEITVGNDSIVNLESVVPNVKNKVIGKKVGETNLTVTLDKGNKEKKEVTVPITVTYPNLKEIKFKAPYFELELGKPVALRDVLIFNPSTVNKVELEKTFQMESSLPNKINVDKKGDIWYIEALEVGTSLVTVEAPEQPNGNKPKASAYFEVKDESTSTNSPTNGKW